MYRITWKLLVLFSLVLPILASPVPGLEAVRDLEMRDAHSGRVHLPLPPSAHGALSPTSFSQMVDALVRRVVDECPGCPYGGLGKCG